MSMLYPYGDQSDPTPEDPYPYEDYYGHGSGRPPRRCRRNRGGWWLLLLLVVVIGGVVAVLSRFSVNLRQTSSGVTLSIQSPSSSSDEETQAAETAGDDLAILQPSGDPTGSGAQLMVTETPGPLPETSADGGQVARYDLGRSYLKGCDLGGDGFALLLTGPYREGSADRAVVVGPDGLAVQTLELTRPVLDLSAAGSYCALLTGSDLTIYTRDLTLYAALDDPQGARLTYLKVTGGTLRVKDVLTNRRADTPMQANSLLDVGFSAEYRIKNIGIKLSGENLLNLDRYAWTDVYTSAYYSSESTYSRVPGNIMLGLTARF